MTQAYPLSWPPGRPRRPIGLRKTGRFSTSLRSATRRVTPLTLADALERLMQELNKIGAAGIVISTNIELRRDGLPRSSGAEPNDPAVAVYFQHAEASICMPCDTYTRAADNLAAIAAHIEATRAIERHGVASVAEMFTGFLQLPPPKQWWEILGVARNSHVADVENAFRNKARRAHPDTGGSNAAMAELNAARDQAMKELVP
jgi:uncharacterized protein YbjQ (UPF0145 family)